MNRCCRWVVVLAAGLAPRWAAADDEPKPDVDVEELSQMDIGELLNVDVSVASKVESTAADAPSSVTVFTQEEIRNMGVTNLQELLNFVPGFQTMREVEQGLSIDVG